MSDELDSIERGIRATRARLAANLSVLTSDTTLDELKSTVKAQAFGVSDDLLDRAKTSGLSMLRKGLDDLKDKAMENPAAVAAIGAGIGWKLWKNPPVASALVGYGLFSLLRGSDNDPLQNALRDVRDRIDDTTHAALKSARESVHDLRDRTASIAEGVQRKASTLLGEVEDKAATGAGEIRERVSALAGDARGTASRLAADAEAMGQDAKEFGQDLWAKSQRSGQVLFDDVAGRARQLRADPQSQILLSIAGVAVAAAVGVAVSRYRSETR